MAEKFQDQIRFLYHLLPPQPDDHISLQNPIDAPVLPEGSGPTNTNITGIDFPDVEFFPNLDEFIWTE